MPNTFKHVEILLEKEISQVREELFHMNGAVQRSDKDLPEPSGSIVNIQRKVFVPVSKNPTYNFVGRLLGPRGLTAKQLEQFLDCKIMVRGKGSMRDKRKEDQNRGKPNWEHLKEELHVLISVEDYENRVDIKLNRAVEAIQGFIEDGIKTPENEDRLKQIQLMELAVLNDKDRQQQMSRQQQQLLSQQQSLALLNNQTALAAVLAAQNHPLLAALQLQAATNCTPLSSLGSNLFVANSFLPGLASLPAHTVQGSSFLLPSGASANNSLPQSSLAPQASSTLSIPHFQPSSMLPNLSSISPTASIISAIPNLPQGSLAALISATENYNATTLNSTSSGQNPLPQATSVPYPFLPASINQSMGDLQSHSLLGNYAALRGSDFDISLRTLKLRQNAFPSQRRMHPYFR